MCLPTLENVDIVTFVCQQWSILLWLLFVHLQCSMLLWLLFVHLQCRMLLWLLFVHLQCSMLLWLLFVHLQCSMLLWLLFVHLQCSMLLQLLFVHLQCSMLLQLLLLHLQCSILLTICWALSASSPSLTLVKGYIDRGSYASNIAGWELRSSSRNVEPDRHVVTITICTVMFRNFKLITNTSNNNLNDFKLCFQIQIICSYSNNTRTNICELNDSVLIILFLYNYCKKNTNIFSL